MLCFCCSFLLVFLSNFAFVAYLVLPGEFYPNRLFTQIKTVSGDNHAAPAIRETVTLPDQSLVFLKYPLPASLSPTEVKCIYLDLKTSQPKLQLPPLFIEGGYQDLQIVRCPVHPPGTVVSLDVNHLGSLEPGRVYTWDSLAYEAAIDGDDNSTLVFVKGLNLRQGRTASPSKYKCIYFLDQSDPESVVYGEPITVAQEIVRCRTPISVLGLSHNPIKVSVRDVIRRTARTLDSVAWLKHVVDSVSPREKKHKLCVCTMLRNQAEFLAEWIMYHARIGVDRCFLYDNNSDDYVQDVVESLVRSNHNVTRHPWPWIKSQEAGFSHCAFRSRGSCQWVAFVDVDEFLYSPSNSSLPDLIENEAEVGEVRVPCHTFGPSGHKQRPKRGVIDGYTCRLAGAERHKSIVKPEALSPSLMNVVHHFYVSDWQQHVKAGSKDRAPGLGTRPTEPADWSTRFCERNDTGLKNQILGNLVDPITGLLPWEQI